MIYNAETLTLKDSDIVYGTGYGFDLVRLEAHIGSDNTLWLRNDSVTDSYNYYEPDGFKVISDDMDEVLRYNVVTACPDFEGAIKDLKERKAKIQSKKVLTVADMDRMIDEKYPNKTDKPNTKPKQNFPNKKPGNKNNKRGKR